ncbi:MAG: inositol monophosphatase [Alphaproteobacteria bacterium]|nr:inositol monophosphatase [Alphaproteobacteria bacterium]
MSLPLDKVGPLLREAADRYVMPRFRSLDEGEIREKGPNDLVTVADEEAEAFLTPRLENLIPGSLVVGEEAASADSGLLDRYAGDDLVWTIDPVDGTANFAKGSPKFCMMVALSRGAELIGGWIYDPAGGRLYRAEAGAGTLREDDEGDARRLAPLAPRAMAPHGIISLKFMPQEMRQTVRERAGAHGGGYTSGCAGQDYIKLIEGGIDYAIYRRIMPWDHAAGVLLHQEVGGYAAFRRSGAYTPRIHQETLIIARDEGLWQVLSEDLFADLPLDDVA